MKQIINFALAVCGALVLFMGLFIIGPEIETRFFPVYSKFTIVSAEPYGEGQTRAVFQFTKLRQCDPQGSAWFSGELGAAFRQLPVSLQGQASSPRPLGTQVTSPYIIDAPPEIVLNAVFAEIYSRCWPLWITRSEVYP